MVGAYHKHGLDERGIMCPVPIPALHCVRHAPDAVAYAGVYVNVYACMFVYAHTPNIYTHVHHMRDVERRRKRMFGVWASHTQAQIRHSTLAYALISVPDASRDRSRDDVLRTEHADCASESRERSGDTAAGQARGT